MIADGCGFGQIAAADYYEFGEIGKQVYERFPVRLAVSTGSVETGGYNPDSAWADFGYVLRRPTDSGAAATAMAAAMKTAKCAIGMDPQGRAVENIVERCEALGKSTGVVTSVPFAHATPAAFVTHHPNRNSTGLIANAMIASSRLEVLMGCGHPEYDDRGNRVDSLNLKKLKNESLTQLQDSLWTLLKQGKVGADADGDSVPDLWTFVEKREDFQSLAKGPAPKRVIGIVRNHSTLQEGREGDPFAPPFAVPLLESMPTLAEMTEAALNVLDDDRDGFFLMVEGGAVDWASHKGRTGRMIEEMIDFNRAVKTVVRWIKSHGGWNQTLLVVTADHETGYPTSPKADSLWAATPLAERGGLRLPRNEGKGRMPDLVWNTPNHTNALVPLFANGSGSDRFLQYGNHQDPIRGPYIENTDIGKVLFELNHP